MSDLFEILVGSMVCLVPPVALVGLLVWALRSQRNTDYQSRITALEALVGELRGQNLTLLSRVSRLEAFATSIATSAPASAPAPASASAPAAAPSGEAAPSAPDPAVAPSPAVQVAATPAPSGDAPPVPIAGAEPVAEAPIAAAAGVVDPAHPTVWPAEPPAVAASSAELPSAELPSAPAAGASGAGASAPAAQAGPTQAVSAQAVPAAASAGPASGAPASPSTPAEAPRGIFSGLDLEQWIGVRGAAALGASILVLAGIYFFEYSIEAGLITPAMRMIAGVLLGLGCVVGSELKLRRAHPTLGQWLTGAGVAILYVAFWAGRALYDLYPTWVAGLLLVAVTGAAVTLAVRRKSMPTAILGLLGGFVTPLALSSGHDQPLPLFSYLLVLDAAMLWVAYRRRWPWLAALCLLATAVYQHGWLLGRLDEPRLFLGVAIVGVFAALFAALPRMRADEAEEEPAIWRLTRVAAVLLPLLFTVPLAVRTDLGETFWATAVQLVLLSVAACWVGWRQRSKVLPVAAALLASGALLGWVIAHPPQKALSVWLVAGLALALSLVFHALDELSRRRLEMRFEQPAAVMHLAVLSAAALGGAFALAAGPWPWVVLLAAAGLLLVRVGSGGAAALPTAAAALTGIGLGMLLMRTHEGTSHVVLLGVAVFLAAASQLAGLAPWRSAEDRARGDHAAALLAALLMPFVVAHPDSVVVPSIALFGALLALALLVVFVAARRAEGAWMLAALVLSALAGTAHVLRFADGPFDAVTLVGLLASAALFMVAPVLAPARLRAQPWAWRVAALAGPLHLVALRQVYLDLLGASTIGALPLVLAAGSLGAAYAVRVRGPEEPEARRVAIVWLSAACAGLVTLAIPLQLENEWLTIGWALEAVALLALWRRLDHTGLKYLAFALAGAVLVRLVLNPYVLGYYPRSELRLINWLSYTYLVPAICLVAMWALLRGAEVARRRPWERQIFGETHPVLANIAAGAAIGVVFAWINLTIFDWFGTGSALEIPFDRLPARDLSLSIAWAVYAVGLLGLGMWRRSTALRAVSLGLILVTSAKVFLYDLAHLSDLYRVASLAGLAVSLIVISLAYQRFVFRRNRESHS